LQLIPTSSDRSKSALAIDCPEADGPEGIEDQGQDIVYERGSGLWPRHLAAVIANAQSL